MQQYTTLFFSLILVSIAGTISRLKGMEFPGGEKEKLQYNEPGPQQNKKISRDAHFANKALMLFFQSLDYKGVELSLENGASVHGGETDGSSILHTAPAAMIKLLFEHGADVHAINNAGLTPLGEALRSGTYGREKIWTLLKCGAQVGGNADLFEKFIAKTDLFKLEKESIVLSQNNDPSNDPTTRRCFNYVFKLFKQKHKIHGETEVDPACQKDVEASSYRIGRLNRYFLILGDMINCAALHDHLEMIAMALAELGYANDFMRFFNHSVNVFINAVISAAQTGHARIIENIITFYLSEIKNLKLNPLEQRGYAEWKEGLDRALFLAAVQAHEPVIKLLLALDAELRLNLNIVSPGQRLNLRLSDYLMPETRKVAYQAIENMLIGYGQARIAQAHLERGWQGQEIETIPDRTTLSSLPAEMIHYIGTFVCACPFNSLNLDSETDDDNEKENEKEKEEESACESLPLMAVNLLSFHDYIG